MYILIILGKTTTKQFCKKCGYCGVFPLKSRLFGDKSKSAFLRVGFGRRAFYFTGTVAPRKVICKAKLLPFSHKNFSLAKRVGKFC